MIRIGVAPDIEAGLDPALVRHGNGPQLGKAIETARAELDMNPLPRPKRPAHPDYHK
jgi:carbamate kinase